MKELVNYPKAKDKLDSIEITEGNTALHIACFVSSRVFIPSVHSSDSNEITPSKITKKQHKSKGEIL
jgi:hypothetical protein